MKNRITSKLPGTATAERHSDSDGDESSGNISDAALRQLNAVRETAEEFIGSHPLICLGAAVATGIAVGWLVKRR